METYTVHCTYKKEKRDFFDIPRCVFQDTEWYDSGVYWEDEVYTVLLLMNEIEGLNDHCAAVLSDIEYQIDFDEKKPLEALDPEFDYNHDGVTSFKIINTKSVAFGEREKPRRYAKLEEEIINGQKCFYCGKKSQTVRLCKIECLKYMCRNCDKQKRGGNE